MKTRDILLVVLVFVNILSAQGQKSPLSSEGEAVKKEMVNPKSKQGSIVHELLAAFNQGAENVLELFDEEAIIEYPYAFSLGTPSSLNKTEYGNYLKGALPNMPDISFSNVNVYRAAQKNILWAEFHGEVVIPSTNQLYRQDYVVRVILKKGKIFHYKEYWNPMAVSALGEDKEINEMFNEKSKQ